MNQIAKLWLVEFQILFTPPFKLLAPVLDIIILRQDAKFLCEYVNRLHAVIA
jgi:hypothetical protein